MKHYTGAILSEHDNRDYDIVKAGVVCSSSDVEQEYPENYIIDYLPNSCYDQGNKLTCVAWALAYIKETQDIKENAPFEEKQCSSAFIYANRADTDHQGDGMSPRQALKQMNKIGVCKYSMFPYNENYADIKKMFFSAENFSDMITDAFVRKVNTYYRLSTLEEIKYTLMNVGPVLISVPTYKGSYWNSKTGVMTQGPKSAHSDYHAMVIVGWRNNSELIIQNSWGSSWGDNGRGYLDYNNYDICELWAVTDYKTEELLIEYEKQNHKHEFSEWVTKHEPTCTENGYKIRTCLNNKLIDCSETETEIIPMKNHKYTQWEEVSRNIFSGLVSYKRNCVYCNKEEKQSEIKSEITIWSIIMSWLKSLFK